MTSFEHRRRGAGVDQLDPSADEPGGAGGERWTVGDVIDLDGHVLALDDLFRGEPGIIELGPGFELVLTLPTARQRVKRVIDVVLGSVLILLLLPLFAGVAAAIKLTSPGPVLFRQERVGRGGARFRVLKFRTMEMGADDRLMADPGLAAAYADNHFKVPEHLDPRVTRIGRLLRVTSLDELPQLLNVVAGHMSLVGPRPVVPDEIARYGPLVPAYTAVRPGLTGEWQVQGRSRIGYPTRAVIDFTYVHRWGLLHDFVILLRTIPAVLTRRGAY